MFTALDKRFRDPKSSGSNFYVGHTQYVIPSSSAPFGRSSTRGHEKVDVDDSPGPGSYLGVTKVTPRRPKTMSATFKSQSQRFHEPLEVKEGVPGPGSYASQSTVEKLKLDASVASPLRPRTAPFGSRTTRPGPDSRTPFGSTNTHLGTVLSPRGGARGLKDANGVVWVPAATAPSIPSRTSTKTSFIRDPNTGQIVPAPGVENGSREVAPNTYNPCLPQETRVSDFGKAPPRSTFQLKNGDYPPPGAYSPVVAGTLDALTRDSRAEIGGVSLTRDGRRKVHLGTSSFASSKGGGAMPTGSFVPGPGSYNLGKVNGINGKIVPKRQQHFGSTAPRSVAISASSGPAPGSYHNGSAAASSRGGKAPVKRKGNTSAAFGTSTSRMHGKRTGSAPSPGPGSYHSFRGSIGSPQVGELGRGDWRGGSRVPVFGTRGARFPKKPKKGSAKASSGPDPGAYAHAQGTIAERAHMARERARITGRGSSSFTTQGRRNNPAGSMATDGPGPNAYDTRPAMAKLKTQTSHHRGQGTFISKAPRTTHKIDDIPGVGAYGGAAPSFTSKKNTTNPMTSRSSRFAADRAKEVPGPGTYSPAAADSGIVRRSFNVRSG